jgi:hypothetical protein
VQGGWWSVPRAGAKPALLSGLAAGVSTPDSVNAVCLVGALVRAASGQGPDAGAGRAIDAVHDAEGRTSEEVLAVLDRAISRTMLSLAAIPAPQADSSAWPGPELAEKNQ